MRKAPLALAMAALLCTVALLPVTALAASRVWITPTDRSSSSITFTVEFLGDTASTVVSNAHIAVYNTDRYNGRTVYSKNPSISDGGETVTVTVPNLPSGATYTIYAGATFDGVVFKDTVSSVQTTGYSSGRYNDGWHESGWYDYDSNWYDERYYGGWRESGYYADRYGAWYDSAWYEDRYSGWRDDGWHENPAYSQGNRVYGFLQQPGSWSGGNATFSIDSGSSIFRSLSVNGTTLAQGSQFSVYQDGYGHIVVTLFDSYLSTLANGAYSVNFNLSGGSASASLTVNRAGTVAATPAAPSATTTVTTVIPVAGTGTYRVSVRSALNVRSAPNASGAKLGSLASGAVITVGQVLGGWGNINYGGTSGWVSMRYLAYTQDVG